MIGRDVLNAGLGYHRRGAIAFRSVPSRGSDARDEAHHDGRGKVEFRHQLAAVSDRLGDLGVRSFRLKFFAREIGSFHHGPVRSVAMTGHSMAAHATWNLALHYPTYFAAINPMADKPVTPATTAAPR